MKPSSFDRAYKSDHYIPKTNMSCNKNQRSNMGKAVRFAPSCTLRLFTAPTARIRDTLWYNPSDYSAFREECKTVLKLGRLAGVKAVDETGKYTCRGLEHMYSRKLAYLREVRRQEALQTLWSRNSYTKG
jgi:hypothetical protein